jgi:hypothetical protein
LVFETKLKIETLSIERECFDRMDSCTLIATGKWLAYHITLDGGWVFLRVQLMDAGDEPQQLLSGADGAKGWRTICRLVAALERNQVKSLERPIEAGEVEMDL